MELRNKKQSNIYGKIIGCFTKKGKKVKAKNILSKSLVNVSKILGVKSIDVLKKFTNSLGVIIDLRTVKIRRNTFTVPVPVNSNRRNYLIAKKISKVVEENSSNQCLEKKLSQEFLNILRNKNSKSLQQRDLTVKDAVKNKSNLHYRW